MRSNYFSQDNDDFLSDEESPYSTISDRVPLEDVSGLSESRDLLANGGISAPPTISNYGPNPAVKAAIAQRTLASKPRTHPPEVPRHGEYSTDPEMQQYEVQQAEVDKQRHAMLGANQALAMGQIGAQLATGGQSEYKDSGASALTQKAGAEMLKGKEEDMDRRKNIMNAIEQRKSREGIRSENAQNRAAAMQMTQSNKIGTDQDKAYTTMRHDLESFRGNQAAQQAALKIQNADTALAIVKNKDPNTLSTQDLNLLANEMGKLASGGVPGEHGVQAMMPNNLQTKLAEMQSFISSKPTDAQAGEYIKRNMAYLDEMKQVAQGTLNSYRSNIAKGYKNRVKPEDYASAATDYGFGEATAHKMTAGAESTFPKQVRKDGHVATVSTQAEFDEARKEGFQ
jgi:hypothetical protein